MDAQLQMGTQEAMLRGLYDPKKHGREPSRHLRGETSGKETSQGTKHVLIWRWQRPNLEQGANHGPEGGAGREAWTQVTPSQIIFVHHKFEDFVS